MRKASLFCSFLLFALYSNAQTTVKVMSFNIRLDVKSDGDNWWEKRKDKVAALMNYYASDFIGAQEVEHHQLQYLLGELKGYGHIGVGRDDGKTEGEYSCIFFNKEKFKVIQQSTFWLSVTPDSVSRGWDAACNRVCTYGLFQSKKTKKNVWIFNTHLDHMGTTARFESVKLVAQKINELTNSENTPVIITGDFNARPNDEPVKFMLSAFLNSRTISEMPAYGPADTWNGFQFDKVPEGCIDYIFCKRT
ncbi:MAG: endonuclease/exonuclease/phosphatase family protein [Chitinophagaceae bacterium]|nr:endonuclease/exonuclease/phosphatase family protein [Chitinophagaceae bacterium]